MPFSDLGLAPSLTRVLAERNYEVPTPVQVETIPAILEGRDVWACAETGSGKTAAYALPILQRLLDTRPVDLRRPFALVIVPTRELAAQVAEFFELYSAQFTERLKIVTAVGGISINPQMMALRGGAHIVVATPGRLLDLVEKNALRLAAASIVVFDEADRLFELGFNDELGRILELLGKRRQNLLFSATYPEEVKGLAKSILNKPLRLGLGESIVNQPDPVGLAEGILDQPDPVGLGKSVLNETVPVGPREVEPVETPKLTERVIELDVERRTQVLRHLLENNDWSRVLVFAASTHATERIAEKLNRFGIEAAALHGKLSQGARTDALAAFKASQFRVLVATDLASRGLDIVQLPVVINYDLPRSTAAYTHRIGRTARAGASGLAISFVSADSHDHCKLIEKRIERTLPREQIEGFEPNRPVVQVKTRTGGIKGKRKSKKDKLREAAAEAAKASSPETGEEHP